MKETEWFNLKHKRKKKKIHAYIYSRQHDDFALKYILHNLKKQKCELKGHAPSFH